MKLENLEIKTSNDPQKAIIVTAGDSYLDIDAYASCIAMRDLLVLQGENAIACSNAPCNYSVAGFTVIEGDMLSEPPADFPKERAEYIVVDVSDPEYIKSSVPLDRVVKIYDHHTGFEDFWRCKIGTDANIEFIGAAATLVWREWKRSGLQSKIRRSTALLMIAAILDNTLNLISKNTKNEDIVAFNELCMCAGVGNQWCEEYFSEVQKKVTDDLACALQNDVKSVSSGILPSKIGQLCLWDAENVLEDAEKIGASLFSAETWMINIIDLKQRLGYFICTDNDCKRKLEQVYGIRFEKSVAKLDFPILRKEIIKKALSYKEIGGQN